MPCGDRIANEQNFEAVWIAMISYVMTQLDDRLDRPLRDELIVLKSHTTVAVAISFIN